MTELLVILVVGLLVLGPKRLPELARSLGRGLAEFRRASTDMRREFLDVTEEIKRETPDDPASWVSEPTDPPAALAEPSASEGAESEADAAERITETKGG